jgi:hypothetical protein
MGNPPAPSAATASRKRNKKIFGCHRDLLFNRRTNFAIPTTETNIFATSKRPANSKYLATEEARLMEPGRAALDSYRVRSV